MNWRHCTHQKKAFACSLGADSLYTEKRSVENLGLSAIMIFTWFFVTHVSILTSDISILFYNKTSKIYRTFCYLFIFFPYFRIWKENENRRFGEFLELRYIFGAPRHRPVSYYAFFKGWLLPSLPPGCLSLGTSFTTQKLLKNLSVRSGLFPSWLETLAPLVCLYSF